MQAVLKNNLGIRKNNIIRRTRFKGMSIRISPNQLAAVSYPAIAHLAEDHFVVVFDVTSEQMTIGDPATGLRQIHVSEFASDWTGALLLVRCKTSLDAGAEEPKE